MHPIPWWRGLGRRSCFGTSAHPLARRSSSADSPGWDRAAPTELEREMRLSSLPGTEVCAIRATHLSPDLAESRGPRYRAMARNSSPPQRPTMSVGRSDPARGSCRFLQSAVSAGVAKDVVDFLELVDIDHDHAERDLCAPGTRSSRYLKTSPGNGDWAVG